jgi:hypothetical protein
MAERFRNYLDREEPQLSTIDGRTGADRLLDCLRGSIASPASTRRRSCYAIKRGP